MALATTLKPEYIMVQLTPEAKTWLVNRELLTGVNLMTSLRLLTQTIEMRRTKSETFSVAPYIFMGKARDEFHADVEALHQIYLECISHCNNVIVNPDGTFTATPNKLDIISALEDVLENSANPSLIQSCATLSTRAIPDSSPTPAGNSGHISSAASSSLPLAARADM